MKLVFGCLCLLLIRCIHHINNSADSSTVPLPHTAEAWLTSNVPELYGHVAFGDFPHVESYCWDHVFVELPRRDHVDEGGLARILQAHQCELHLLLPEEGLEPVQQLVKQSDHPEAGQAALPSS